MLSQSDWERERHEGRLKQRRDMKAFFTDIHRQGLKRLLHFCERLLERPETPEEQLNCLPDAEFERLLKGLETEVLDNICRLSGSPNE